MTSTLDKKSFKDPLVNSLRRADTNAAEKDVYRTQYESMAHAANGDYSGQFVPNYRGFVKRGQEDDSDGDFSGRRMPTSPPRFAGDISTGAALASPLAQDSQVQADLDVDALELSDTNLLKDGVEAKFMQMSDKLIDIMSQRNS